MLLSVIIVSYNTQELTIKAIEAVIKDVQASKLLKDETEVILVDNHSTDETLDEVRQLKKRTSVPVTIVANDHNLGFAKANNQGFEKAKGSYLLLLNSDTVVQEGALERLVLDFENNPIQDLTAELQSHTGELDRLGIVSATLLNPDQTLQAHGGSFPTLVSLAGHWLMLDDLPVIGKLFPSTQHTGLNTRQSKQASKLIQQDWVGGTAMLIRKQVIDEIGDLDGRIFMYGEDVEFCLRARKHHWDVAIDPQAKVIHLGSASSSSLNALRGEVRGYVYIWSKHQPLWQLGIAKMLIAIGCQLRVWVFGTMKGDTTKAGVYRTILQELQRSK